MFIMFSLEILQKANPKYPNLHTLSASIDYHGFAQHFHHFQPLRFGLQGSLRSLPKPPQVTEMLDRTGQFPSAVSQTLTDLAFRCIRSHLGCDGEMI
jgi:hypothetical protein